MRKNFTSVFILVLLAGCSGSKKTDGGDIGAGAPREAALPANAPDIALPGIPLKSELEDEYPAFPEEAQKAAVSAAPAAETAPEPALPAAAPAPAASPAGGKDLDFHLAAARKYSARKKYRSAAAEYEAAAEFLPAGDVRAVQVLERQGAMLLRAGDEPRAQERFLKAIAKAGELNSSGKVLADSYLGLGYCQEKAKKVQDALLSYEKALELSTSRKIKARIAGTIKDLKKNP